MKTILSVLLVQALLLATAPSGGEVPVLLLPSLRPTQGQDDALVVADFDGDAIDDVAVGSANGPSILVHFSSGESVVQPIGSAPWSLAAGDLDGDGDLDIAAAVGTWVSGPLHILENLGDRTFYERQIPNRGGGTVALVDLTGNGLADIVAVTRFVRVHWNAGNYQFATGPYWPEGGDEEDWIQAASLSAGDMDGDVDRDVVALYFTYPPPPLRQEWYDVGLLLLENRQAPYVTWEPFSDGFAADVSRGGLSLGDLDGDGDLDMVVGVDDEILVFQHSWHTWLEGVYDIAGCRGPVACVRQDADLLPDIFAGGAGQGLWSLANQGGFSFAAPVAFPQPVEVRALSVGQANRLGLAGDLHILRRYGAPSSEGLLIAPRTEDGFGLAPPSDTLPDVGAVHRWADFDGDSLADLAFVRDDRIVLWQGLGGGRFAERQQIAVAGGVTDFEAADLDGDALADLAVLSPGDARLRLWQNGGAWQFAPRAPLPLPTVPTRVDAVPAAAGPHDLIVFGGWPRAVVVLNDGDWDFTLVMTQMPFGAETAAFDDIDRDLQPEWIAVGSTERTIVIYGLGVDGVLDLLHQIDLAAQPTCARAIDLEMEGDKELVVFVPGENALWLYRDCREFIGEHPLPLGTTAIRLADIDRSSRPVILAGSSSGRKLEVLSAAPQSSPPLTAASYYAPWDEPVLLDAVDLGGGTWLEIAVFAPGAPQQFFVVQTYSTGDVTGLPGAPIGPRALDRLRSFPNPANGAVRIVPAEPFTGPAHLEILDAGGRIVRRIVARQALPSIDWDGTDDHGRSTPPGIYLVRLRSPSGTAMAKFVRLR